MKTQGALHTGMCAERAFVWLQVFGRCQASGTTRCLLSLGGLQVTQTLAFTAPWSYCHASHVGDWHQRLR